MGLIKRTQRPRDGRVLMMVCVLVAGCRAGSPDPWWTAVPVGSGGAFESVALLRQPPGVAAAKVRLELQHGGYDWLAVRTQARCPHRPCPSPDPQVVLLRRAPSGEVLHWGPFAASRGDARMFWARYENEYALLYVTRRNRWASVALQTPEKERP